GYASSTGAGTLTLSGAVAGGFMGIYFQGLPSATLPCNLNDNIVSDISFTSTTGTFYGIYNGSTSSSNTININGNTVRNIATVTTTGIVNPVNAGSATTLNISNNTIDVISRTGAGAFYGISYGASGSVTLNLNT